MVDCLVEGKAVSLRVYKAMFTDEDFKDKGFLFFNQKTNNRKRTDNQLFF